MITRSKTQSKLLSLFLQNEISDWRQSGYNPFE